MCLAVSQKFAKLNFDTKDFNPCHKQVPAVGGSKLLCNGWVLMNYQIHIQVIKQPVYICQSVKEGCMELNILHPNFSRPMNGTAAIFTDPIPTNPKTTTDSNTLQATLPERPGKIPFLLTTNNISKLKNYLLTKFNDTALN